MGCVGSSWGGEVERWGTLREVLRDGQVQGRVRLAELVGRSGGIGVGALKDLSGEVTIVGDQVWITVGETGTTRAVDAHTDYQAAFLVHSRVPKWRRVSLTQGMTLKDLESVLSEQLKGSEWQGLKTVPFIVNGQFDEIDSHVINGGCPFAADESLRKEPVRDKRRSQIGKLVGFTTSSPPGTISHHGSSLHVHSLLTEPRPYTGHVDRVIFGEGCWLLIPMR